MSEADHQIIYEKVYENLMQGIDGIDNGVSSYLSNDGTPAVRQYKVHSDLSSRVGRLNPSWNEPSTDEIAIVSLHELVHLQFKKQSVLFYGR